jgi:hypothetical protein
MNIETSKHTKKRKSSKKNKHDEKTKYIKEPKNSEDPECTEKENKAIKPSYKLIKPELIDEYKMKCSKYDYIPAILPKVTRLIILPDIHGDFKLFTDLIVNVAKIAQIRIKPTVANGFDSEFVWVASDTYVVQVGDQIDRCRPMGNIQCDNPNATHDDEDSDYRILMAANDLHHQAIKTGGKFISLLGNHEILNADGIMTYVSKKGLDGYDGYVDKNTGEKFTSGIEGRIHAYKPGNEMGSMMGCTRLPAVIVGSHLMVHAGMVDGIIDQLKLDSKDDLESINIAVRLWLTGLLERDHVNNIIKSSKHGMFWTRILGNIPPGVSYDNPVCKNNIGQILNLFQIGSIVVGHTPMSFTFSDDINGTCDGKIWRVDNGSSRAFNKFDRIFLNSGSISHSRRAQVLEIINDDEYYLLDGIHTKRSLK